MGAKVQIVSLRKVEDAQVVLIGAASFRGSEVFGGTFEVADEDTCIAIDTETGIRTVSVICRYSGDPDGVQDFTFELHDPIPHLAVGFIGMVAEQIVLG